MCYYRRNKLQGRVVRGLCCGRVKHIVAIYIYVYIYRYLYIGMQSYGCEFYVPFITHTNVSHSKLFCLFYFLFLYTHPNKFMVNLFSEHCKIYSFYLYGYFFLWIQLYFHAITDHMVNINKSHLFIFYEHHAGIL